MWMSVVYVGGGQVATQNVRRSSAGRTLLRGCLNAITTSFGELQKHVRKQGADVTGLHAACPGGSALSESVHLRKGMYNDAFSKLCKRE
jgi:hypothetical protein